MWKIHEMMLQMTGMAGENAGLSAEGLKNYTEKVFIGCGSDAGHSAKVENHGIDSAIQEAYGIS
jgi:hypothetical protein